MDAYMQQLIQKAGILVDALPYIQRLNKKTVVIKYGGNAMINEDLKKSVTEDITLLKFVGINPVIVHGGGPDISEALKAYGIKSEFVNGLRVTDESTMRVAQMVLVGKTNKEIVSLLNAKGGKAIGLCGLDGRLIQCKKLEMPGADLGFVGEIVKVDAKVINLLTADEYIPVIAPVGVDEFGQSYNINADTVAAEVAKALKAEKLMYLTDVEGVKDVDGNVIFAMKADDVEKNIENGVISGGMIPKVRSCKEAVEHGVKRVHIIDGRILHAILLEIFTKSGIGTMIAGDVIKD